MKNSYLLSSFLLALIIGYASCETLEHATLFTEIKNQEFEEAASKFNTRNLQRKDGSDFCKLLFDNPEHGNYWILKKLSTSASSQNGISTVELNYQNTSIIYSFVLKDKGVGIKKSTNRLSPCSKSV